MSESREIQSMRLMEWERTKGSIRSVMASFWELADGEFEMMEQMIDDFIEKFGGQAGLE